MLSTLYLVSETLETMSCNDYEGMVSFHDSCISCSSTRLGAMYAMFHHCAAHTSLLQELSAV